MSWITVAIAKEDLGIPTTDNREDSRIQRLLNAAQIEIEHYIQNKVVEVTDLTWLFFGRNSQIRLPYYPVTGITSIADPAGNTIDSDDYVLVAELGLVKHRTYFPNAVDSNGASARWTITYDAGLFADEDAVTPDFEEALSVLVARRYERHESGIASRRLGDASISYRSPAGDEQIPIEVQQLLSGYVKHGV